jgi:hypothetical protein
VFFFLFLRLSYILYSLKCGDLKYVKIMHRNITHIPHNSWSVALVEKPDFLILPLSITHMHHHDQKSCPGIEGVMLCEVVKTPSFVFILFVCFPSHKNEKSSGVNFSKCRRETGNEEISNAIMLAQNRRRAWTMKTKIGWSQS